MDGAMGAARPAGVRTEPRMNLAARILLIGAAWQAALGAPVRAETVPAEAGPVRLDAGPVVGTVEGEVSVFRGIPYARPPVGGLRWRPPQPPLPWTEPRPCTAFGPWCPQPVPMMTGRLGRTDEDCLTLNVWTPSPRRDALKPVMVWIHGGGHTTGSGAMPFYDGAALASRGVVVATLNYRLGPLGYLAHPALSAESPYGVSGNYGLLDQVEALRWVRRNIVAFGGDPTRVTVFGESAGAASIARLLVAPSAQGLFHRAILQSGGPVGHNRHLRERWYGLEPAEAVGRRVAERLGLTDAADPAAALRRVTPRDLLEAADPAQGLFGSGLKFGPCVDGVILPNDPVDLWARGGSHGVPVLVGSNADEGTVFLRQLPVRTAAGCRRVLERAFPGRLEEALRLFPRDGSDEAAVEAALNRVVTVTAFAAPARAMARDAAAHGAKAYLYHFTRRPPLGRRRDLGAFHGLEIGYVFGTVKRRRAFAPADHRLSDTMMGYWVAFARTGDPNGDGRPAWPAWTPENKAAMELGDGVAVRTDLLNAECDLADAARAAKHRRRAEAETGGPLP